MVMDLCNTMSAYTIAQRYYYLIFHRKEPGEEESMIIRSYLLRVYHILRRGFETSRIVRHGRI